jgi:hypothetical protein
MGVVAYANRKMRPKFSNKGRTCMFVGYATNHAEDVYRIVDMETKRITTSRDIRLLNKSYKDWVQTHDANTEEIEEDDGNDIADKVI